MTTNQQAKTKIAEAMWASGIAEDRNNPKEPKPITNNSLTVLKRRYLLKDPEGTILENAPGMFDRVSLNLAEADRSYGPAKTAPGIEALQPTLDQLVSDTAAEFRDLMIFLLFLPNSPTLMNAGARLQQLAACFVLPVEDSLDAIFEGVKQTALIHKSGGGTGFSFSRLRPKGDLVGSTGGVASGPVGFIRAFDVATDVVKQGGTRRGANMAVLRVDHPDILEFVHAKDTSEHLQNFNISVAVTDSFMQAVQDGTPYALLNPRTGKSVRTLDARDVWNQIVTSAHLSGDPGIIFIDQINRHNANPHLGDIEAVNPCVTGDTLVFTKNGLITINDIWKNRTDSRVTVDGRFYQDRFQKADAVIASGIKPIFLLDTEEGYQLRLTSDHRVMTDNGWTPADQLTKGDMVHILNRKGGFSDNGTHAAGVLLGWLTAANTLAPDRAPLPFFANLHLNREFAQATKDSFMGIEPTGQATTALLTKHPSTNTLLHKHLLRDAESLGLTAFTADRVPTSVLQGSQPMQRGYLQTLFSADAAFTNMPDEPVKHNITLPLANPKQARTIQNVLLNFNVLSMLNPQHDHGKTTLTISGYAVRTFAHQVGLLQEPKDRALKNYVNYPSDPQPPQEFKATFKSLEPEGLHQVFDIKEPVTNSFIANGFVVHNCGEQVLRPNEACNLGSINLARTISYDSATTLPSVDYDLLKQICRTAVHMLDNVIDMNNYPSDIISETTRSTRRIGVGVMGLADLLVQLAIPYDSQEACNLAENLMAAIQDFVHEASQDLAAQRGAYPLWEHSVYHQTSTPMRNTAPVTIAPTGTISIIAGASSGIEPLFALCFTRNVMDGTRLTEVNPYFEAIAKHHGFYSEQLMEQVALTGSIQNTDVPQWAKDVFKIASDIRPEDHVRMQAAFQKYTDNAVSKTINFPNSATTEDIQTAYILAHQLACKGITVYRDGSKDNQVLSTGQTATAPLPLSKHTNGYMAAARERPRIMTGYTERFRTGHGNLYVTINLNNEKPFEVFARLGKAGGCDSAQQEAICRLISLALRANIDPNEIIDNLRGITCCPCWDEGHHIMSIPDALAQCLHSYVYNPDAQPQPDLVLQPSLPRSDLNQQARNAYAATGPKCPDCNSPTIFQEGCEKCSNPQCGYNKCT